MNFTCSRFSTYTRKDLILALRINLVYKNFKDGQLNLFQAMANRKALRCVLCLNFIDWRKFVFLVFPSNLLYLLFAIFCTLLFGSNFKKFYPPPPRAHKDFIKFCYLLDYLPSYVDAVYPCRKNLISMGHFHACARCFKISFWLKIATKL